MLKCCSGFVAGRRDRAMLFAVAGDQGSPDPAPPTTSRIFCGQPRRADRRSDRCGKIRFACFAGPLSPAPKIEAAAERF